MRDNWICFAVLAALASCVAYGTTSATVCFDYNTATTVLDNARFLNAARGWKGPIGDSWWHNSFYGNMATVGIRELRIDWLPSDSTYHVISRNASNELAYDFSRLDAVILPLLKTGMRPLMCMNMENVAALGISNGMPANMNDYAAAVKAFVQHYKDLGYTGLTWESHNEPELFSTLTPQQTYYMYDVFAVAVKEIDPTAIVGGHGTSCDHLSYIGQFLDAYNGDSTKPPINFFSYHQYGSEDFATIGAVESLFISRGITPPQFYLTEWNDHPFVQVDNDTSAHASWVCKKLYWALMNAPRLARTYFFNYADGDTGRVFSGDNGLFTSNNHKKAAANAFNLYNCLHEAVLSSTISGADTSTYDVHALATKDPASGAVSLIIWNNRSVGVSIELSIANLPYLAAEQKFMLTRYIIDGNHGNYYYDYLNSGVTTGTQTVGDSENVDVAEQTLCAPAGSLSRNEYLSAWSVTAIKLDPAGRFDPNVAYEIINCNSGLLLQPNASLQAEQGAFTASACQHWNLVDQGNGWYAILHKTSGQALGVPSGSLTQGTRLAMAAWTGADYQLWNIEDVGSYCKIINRRSKMGMNVSGESRNPGASVIQWPLVKKLNEYWKIQRARPAPGEALRARWKFDETVGTVAADVSGFDKHGIINSTAFESASVAGLDGGALNFDGVDDRVVVPPLNLYSNAVTVTAWIKIDTAVPWSGIFVNRTLNANGLNLGNSGELRYHWNHSMYSWHSGLVPPLGTWTFVALVVEPERGTIYMDHGAGLQSATNVATHKIEGFAGISYIGDDPASAMRHFDGCMDDVRIYKVSLTPSQVAAVRDSADTIPPTPNPMAWAGYPYETGMGEVTMTASTACDRAGVEYYFDCIAGGGHDSGWQSSPVYVDRNLSSLTVEYKVKARDKSPNGNETSFSGSSAATIARYPYGAQEYPIPGNIQVENYDVGGQGVAYYDKSAGNTYGNYRTDDVDIYSSGGRLSVCAEDDEWLEYTVDVLPGTYDVSVRSSSIFSGQNLNLTLDDQPLVNISLPYTGGWTDCKTTTIADIVIASGGRRVLRITNRQAVTMIDSLDFVRHYSPADLDRSTRVDMADLAILVGQWLRTPGSPSADIALSDNSVDLRDLALMAEDWLVNQ